MLDFFLVLYIENELQPRYNLLEKVFCWNEQVYGLYKNLSMRQVKQQTFDMKDVTITLIKCWNHFFTENTFVLPFFILLYKN